MARVNYWKKVVLISVVGMLGLAVGVQAEPKNVIIFIGDGMGPQQVLAGTYYNGGPLSFEDFPYSGELTTYSANSSAPDSAAAATSLATGVKVNNDVISVALPGDGSELETLLEYYQALGRRAGLVTTTYVAHATPAAFGAHEDSRSNYTQIANDYLTQTRPDVIFGGNSYMSGAADAGYAVVTDYASMIAMDTETATMVSGQFGGGYMPYEFDGLDGLPHLSEMTATTLAILDNDPDGFFLMVEGGRIDHACHDNDIVRSVHEAIEFSNAVQVALDWVAANDPTFSDTLILVTADHETGGLSVLADNDAGNYPDVSWSSTGHTAANVPVYAWGENAELIFGVMDNTDMFGVVTATISPEASNPSPADEATGVDINADLIWTAGSGATMHQIYFAGDPVVEQPLGNETYDPGQLLPGTAYSWRIDEVGPGGTTTGAVWSFTTAAAPDQVAGESPGDGVSNVDITTDLNWTAATGAHSYDVYFGSDSLDFKGNQSATTYDPGTLIAGATYYWQIDSVSPGGTTTGAVWSFTTAAAPGQASDPQPPDGTLAVLLETDLSWTAGSGATAHDVYFGVEPETLVLVSEGHTATTYDPGTLDSGTTYYWVVDEVGPGGVTPGLMWTFATAALPWTDGFESGGLAAGGWVTSGQVQVIDDAATGIYAVRTNRAASLEKAISTAGFGSIKVSFAAKTFGMDDGEYLYVEWFDGSDWNPAGTVDRTVSDWAGQTFECQGAEDNPDFSIRFRSNANKNREYVFIDDVQISGDPLGPDETPPTPNPMTWATVPYATGENSIAMTATIASDPSGVEYYFTCTVGGGNDSGWQDSPTYEDTGLASETTYTYTVTARDKSANLNETVASGPASATTDAVDTTAPAPDPMTWATAPYATGSTSVSMTATTATDDSGVEYYFDCTDGGGNDSGWQDSPSYEDTGLSAGTQYTYRVQARDKSPLANTTGWSPEASATPVDLAPAPPTGLAATAGDGQVSLDWDDNSESDLAGYNVYRSTTSGSGYVKISGEVPVSGSSYLDTTVVNDTAYYYIVTAVDLGSNESADSGEVSATPTAQVSDVVTITRADYSIRRQVFTVQATSSQGGTAELWVQGYETYGPMTYNAEENLYTFRETVADAPGEVTVTSDLGGSDTAPVTHK